MGGDQMAASGHSSRKARTGSMRVARRAGSTQAEAATAIRNAVTKV